MTTDDRDDLVPTETSTDSPGTTPSVDAPTDTPDQDQTPEEEPTMSGTTPSRTSAWTTDTSTIDQPVADETPTAAYAPAGAYAEPAAPAAPASPATPVASVPFPRTLDEPRGVRVGTVVWGLVVTAVAVGLLALANGATFDVQLATIVVIAGAGVALLVGSLLGTRRRHG